MVGARLDVSPCSAADDVPDGICGYRVFGGKMSGDFTIGSTSADLAHLRNGEPCRVMPSHPNLIQSVLSPCVIPQIGRCVIGGVPVVVANLRSMWPRAEKGCCDKGVDARGHALAASEQRYGVPDRIATGLLTTYEKPASPHSRAVRATNNSVNASHAAEIADLVVALKSNNRLPKFTGQILNGRSHCAPLSRGGRAARCCKHRLAARLLYAPA